MTDDFESELRRSLPRGQGSPAGTLVEAEWLDPAALRGKAWAYRDSKGRGAGIFLGYREGRPVGTIDDRHVVTVAGSRSGKGVSLIVPNLLIYEGSVLAFDPKGELARMTARARREMGQKVVVLDPFGENGRYPSSCYNPLDELNLEDANFGDDVGNIADALVIGNERDPHWTDSAKMLVKGLILLTLTFKPEYHSLITVRRLLMLTHPAVVDTAKAMNMEREAALFALMKGQDQAFDGLIAGIAGSVAGMGDKERGSVLSTARVQTEWLDSGPVSKVLGRSDFRLADLKREKVTVFVCLPATRMSSHARLMRVLVNLLLASMEREKRKPDIPVLVVMDEFPVLGRMKSIEVAAGLVAGFGVKLWTVLQDLGQIKRDYRESWETFIGNAGVVTFWGNSDHTTLEYISQKLGQTGVRVQQPSGATTGARLSGASPYREELRVQRLLASHEVEALLAREHRRVLVMAAGQRPVILQRAIYYEDGGFRGRFDSTE